MRKNPENNQGSETVKSEEYIYTTDASGTVMRVRKTPKGIREAAEQLREDEEPTTK